MINYNSPAELKNFLDHEGLAMRKKFGQNFLINPQIRNSLVKALDAHNEDDVWEIGSGIGAMTSILLEKGMIVKAFEIDIGFIRILKQFFSHDKNFCLIEGDVMETWPLHAAAPFLIGNLPYNAAAALLADLIERGRVFSRMVVTVQKETALRMAASAGSKDYSSFSVLCASVYNVKPIMLIKRESFYPQPNVDSMGVLLESKRAGSEAKYPAVFYPLVRSLFASRRKTVKNNLFAFLSARADSYFKNKTALELCFAVLRENNINENERAENLDINAFLSLAISIDNMRLFKQGC